MTLASSLECSTLTHITTVYCYRLLLRLLSVLSMLRFVNCFKRICIHTIAAYRSNFGHFAFLSPPPLWGLGTTCDVHLRLIGNRVVDFLLVLIDFAPVGAGQSKI